MPVIGTLAQVTGHFGDYPLILEGLNYLSGLGGNLPSTKDGEGSVRVEVGSGGVFALHQSYLTKPVSEGRYEAHRKYIDIQYVLEGSEIIRVAPLGQATAESGFDEERDVGFYTLGEGQDLHLEPGMAVVLFPRHLHAPCLAAGKQGRVVKVVVKVPV